MGAKRKYMQYKKKKRGGVHTRKNNESQPKATAARATKNAAEFLHDEISAVSNNNVFKDVINDVNNNNVPNDLVIDELNYSNTGTEWPIKYMQTM